MWLAGVAATGEWWLLATLAIMAGIYVRAAVAEGRKFPNNPLAGAYDAYRLPQVMHDPLAQEILRERL